MTFVFWRDPIRFDQVDRDFISHCNLWHRPIEMLARRPINSPNATREASVGPGFSKNPCHIGNENTIIANPGGEEVFAIQVNLERLPYLPPSLPPNALVQRTWPPPTLTPR